MRVEPSGSICCAGEGGSVFRSALTSRLDPFAAAVAWVVGSVEGMYIGGGILVLLLIIIVVMLLVR